VIVTILLQIPVGRLADRIGRKKAFFLFTPFYCLGLIVLIIAPSPEYLILAGILGGAGGGAGIGGGIGGAAFIPFITMWWEMVPAGKRGKWYGLEGIITAAPRIPATIIGGILWDQGVKIPILLAPVLIEFLVVIPLLHTIPETLGSKQ
jgi:MFS family permease